MLLLLLLLQQTTNVSLPLWGAVRWVLTGCRCLSYRDAPSKYIFKKETTDRQSVRDASPYCTWSSHSSSITGTLLRLKMLHTHCTIVTTSTTKRMEKKCHLQRNEWQDKREKCLNSPFAAIRHPFLPPRCHCVQMLKRKKSVCVCLRDSGRPVCPSPSFFQPPQLQAVVHTDPPFSSANRSPAAVKARQPQRSSAVGRMTHSAA